MNQIIIFDSHYTKIITITIFLLTILCRGGSQYVTNPPNTIVAQDGSGEYTTIMAALDMAPNNSITKYYIFIKQGVYNEYVQIEEWKTNIVFIGEGMDKTIITGNKSFGGGFGTYESATVGVNGDDFMAQDITFRNTAGATNQQAVALRASAYNCTFFRCQFDGFQDTLYTHYGRHFYRECIVLGTIDFLCGDATVVLQNSLIEARVPEKGQYIVITAQQRDFKTRETGLVLQNCTLRFAIPDTANLTMYLGRPWGKFSRTVIMESHIDMPINPSGWIEFEGRPLVQPYYLEYNNDGPGANTNGRVQWATSTSDPRIALHFTVRNFISGDTWIPSTVPYYLDLL